MRLPKLNLVVSYHRAFNPLGNQFSVVYKNHAAKSLDMFLIKKY